MTGLSLEKLRVTTWHKPDVGAVYPVTSPDAEDDFDKEQLGLQWQWNANPKDGWYALDTEKHQLILKAVQRHADTITNEPNLLLQKWCMPEFCAETMLNLEAMRSGDMAGLISLGVTYGAVAIAKESDA